MHKRFPPPLAILLLLPLAGAQALPKKFESGVISKQTPGHKVSMEIDISGARQLFLEVGDGGNGSGYDWADWLEPTLVAADGKTRSLVGLTWKSVDGRAQVNRNQGGGPLKVEGREYEKGIGTHATSRIVYDLPAGFATFKAVVAIDDGGVEQPGSHPTVVFRAHTDPNAGAAGNLDARLLPGFRANTLYDVDLKTEGSWVALCALKDGRLIASDRQGAMYRIEVPAANIHDAPAKVERLPVDVGSANGLLEAFGSLYVVGKGQGKSGLFRLTDTTGDDRYDKVEHLVPLAVGSDHHAHAVILSPGGKRLTILCGNNTDIPGDIARWNIQHQDEDQLLPRGTYYGHNTNRKAPGGFVLTCLPDGSDRVVQSSGYRNPYDIAYNHNGDLFTFDADMEYDVGGPWYRPTRVDHSVSGGEFGWRWGAGKWPDYYPDAVAPVVDIGRGSPTGVAFGYGAKFPARYQEALYVLDWTYGKIYAVHMKEKGATYTGEFEEFVAGRALPVSDIVIHPTDGAMYFIAGGRRSKSSLVRVTYEGDEPTTAVKPAPTVSPAHKLRRELEALHGRVDPGTVAKAWPHLSSPDRAIRYAARTAIEHQPAETWARRALEEDEPLAAIEAAVAFARCGDAQHQQALELNLDRIDFSILKKEQQLDLLRAHGLMFIRLGAASDVAKDRLHKRFSDLYPMGDVELDRELCRILLHVEAPGAVAKSVRKLLAAETQADQMFYAYHLRNIDESWSDEDVVTYFSWLQGAYDNRGDYTGGGHFSNFLKTVRKEAFARLSDARKPLVRGQPTLTENDRPKPPPRKLVKEWTQEDLAPALAGVETGRSFIRGKALHGQLCATCHLFNGKGGALGPDLSSVGGKYDYPTLLTEIIDPSRVISDQHAAVLLKLKDGKSVFGREVGGDDDIVNMAVNPLDPEQIVQVKKSDIAERQISPVSMMPTGLLNTLTEEEVLDLMMYLASGGKVGHTAFQK